MKKILLALLLSAFLLSGCGAKDGGNSLSVETNQPSGSTSNPERTEDPEQMENPEQTEDTKQAEKAEVSGVYTDKQGTVVWKGDTLQFTCEAPYVLADIAITDLFLP